ncbi:MAG: adenylyltransferase/cytidyltransferase family protein [Candidatus Coatesbacteria bacterium]|nr:adenylyltransferase/cytidyltransferase family protein [Candidatus Coatesbacteria bacterium]
MDRYFGKRKTLSELEQIVERLREEGRKVVLANGCFDILHVGHTRYLSAAKSLGDCLIVAVNSDSSVRELKGPGRPVMDEDARAEIICGLEATDWVCVFYELNVSEFIGRLRPDIQAKGTDYTEDNVPEREMVKSYGGSVAICGDPKDHATKSVIARIRNSAG